jgi:hypothetical protein
VVDGGRLADAGLAEQDDRRLSARRKKMFEIVAKNN